MGNRYAGICYKCGNPCPPGAGVFEKVSRVARAKWPGLPSSLKWQTQHHECARDYPRDAHYLYNPKPPFHSEARYKAKTPERSA